MSLFEENHLVASQLKGAFQNLVINGDDEDSRNGALALALLGAAPDPNESVEIFTGVNMPLLSASLRLLRKDGSQGALSCPVLDVSFDPSVSLPAEVASLSGAERLAIYLLRSGADPWLKDDSGKDAFDYAIMANSPTLVKVLLKHPGCPSKEALCKRTYDVAPRQLPALHLLAYHGYSELFDYLVRQGWDPDQKDKQGSHPAAWVNSVDMLEFVLDQSKTILDQQGAVDINAVFQRRQQQKWFVLPHFNIEGLSALIEQRRPIEKKDQETLKLRGFSERFLDTPVGRRLYNNPGVRWSYSHEKSVEKTELLDLISRNFAWRHKSNVRATRGDWSPLMACVWAILRTEDKRKEEASVFLPHFHERVLLLQQEEREAFFKEEISPGLTNAGLLVLACLGLHQKSNDMFKELGVLQGVSDDRRHYMTLAAQTACELIKKSSSEVWVKTLSRRLDEVASHLGLYASVGPGGSFVEHEAETRRWLYPIMEELSEKGLLAMNMDAINFMKQCFFKRFEDERPLERDEVGCIHAVLNIRIDAVLGMKEYQRYGAAADLQKIRAELWHSLSGRLADTPSPLLHMKDKDYPFMDFGERIGNRLTHEQAGIPTKEEWDAMINRVRLNEIAADRSSETASKNAKADRKFRF